MHFDDCHCFRLPRLRRELSCVATAACLMLISLGSAAAVGNITIVDVRPNAASAVWASDESVTAAGLRIFSDVGGTNEITAAVVVTVASSAAALANGVVKINVAGLAPNSRYYLQTQTTTASGVTLSPAATPLLEVRTALTATRATAAGQPIANAVIQYPFLAPDGSSAVDDGLVLIATPGLGAYPLSAVTGQGGYAQPYAVANLNNLYSGAGASVAILAQQVLAVEEFRGRRCPLAQQRLLRYRRVAPSGLTVPVTLLAQAAPCYVTDTQCDGEINVLDAQRVMNALDQVAGSCSFNPDLDVAPDGTLNVLDAQRIMNDLGKPVPSVVAPPPANNPPGPGV